PDRRGAVPPVRQRPRGRPPLRDGAEAQVLPGGRPPGRRRHRQGSRARRRRSGRPPRGSVRGPQVTAPTITSTTSTASGTASDATAGTDHVTTPRALSFAFSASDRKRTSELQSRENLVCRL